MTPLTEWHHGGCKGGDRESHELATELGIPVHVHPMTPDRKQDPRARIGATVIYPAKHPLTRNIDMVNISSILYATPKEIYNVKRGSGTWYTIRQGVKKMKKDPKYLVILILPDGTLTDALRIVY